MVDCPTDGCDYSAPTRNSVVAHMSSKTDEGHSGIGYGRANEMIDGSGGTDTEQGQSGNRDVTPDSTPDGNTDTSDGPTEPDSGQSTDDSTNPAFDSPGRSGDAQGDADGTSDETHDTCPDCSGELADFRDTDTIQRNGMMYDTPDDYYCSDCGRGWNVE